MTVPAATGRTLRQIATERGLNVDWDKLNSSGNDDGNAYRQSFFSQLGDLNPYGRRGAVGNERNVGFDVSLIPDDLSGSWGQMAQRLGARDAPELRGMLARGHGEALYSGDRGMYNEYLADLGNMVYDNEFGWLPGEGGFQEGSRVGRSFNNMQMWGPAAVLGVGMAGNALGLGAMEGAGAAAGEAAAGATGGSFGPGMSPITGASPVGTMGTFTPGPASSSFFGGGGAAAAAGGGASAGGGSFLQQIAQSLGLPPEVVSGLNTARQGLSLANTIGGLFGGGGGQNRSGGGMGGLEEIIANAVGGYQSNRNIQNYERQVNEMLDRGDPFRTQRPAYIERLAQLYADPSSIENTPGYKFALDQGTQNLERRLAARGMTGSGNEQGEIMKFGQGLAAQTLDKERNALMQMAGANFDPSRMAGAGIGAFGRIADAQANRNANVLRGVGNGSTSSGISTIANLVRQFWPDASDSDTQWMEDLFDGTYDSEDLPDMDWGIFA